MHSTPSDFSSSRISFVTPNPAAAFSTLAIRKSIPIEEVSSGRRSRTARRPGEPKMSAMKRMFTWALAGVLHRPRLADHHDLDLAGILKLLLHLARDVGGELKRPRVVHVLGLDQDPDLATRLDGEGLLHAGEAVRDLLQGFKPLDVVLDALPARSGTRARDRVGRHDEGGIEILHGGIVMVVADRLDDIGRLA